MKKINTRTLIDLALELCTILLVWGSMVLLLAAFTSCATIGDSHGPAKQQNFSTSVQTSGKGSEIPVTQIDLNQDGVIDATEQTIITSQSPSVLLTFGVISAVVFMSVLLCAWMSNRTTRKNTINQVAHSMMDDSDDKDLLGQTDTRVARVSGS